MIVDLEVLTLSDVVDHVRLKAEVQLDDAVALRARQMGVVDLVLAQTEGMLAVRELDAVKHIHLHQLLYGAVHGSAPNTPIGTSQLLQEFLDGE